MLIYGEPFETEWLREGMSEFTEGSLCGRNQKQGRRKSR